MNFISKKFSCGFLFLSLLSPAIIPDSVRAAILHYDFEVDIMNGPLSGEISLGWLSFDNESLTGIGHELITTENNDLKIKFDFLGKIFTEEDESNETFEREEPVPNILFVDGEFQGLSYRVDEIRGTKLTPIPSPVQDFTILRNGFGYRTETDDQIHLGGVVTYTKKSSKVPEPGTSLALVLLGSSLFVRKLVLGQMA